MRRSAGPLVLVLAACGARASLPAATTEPSVEPDSGTSAAADASPERDANLPPLLPGPDAGEPPADPGDRCTAAEGSVVTLSVPVLLDVGDHDVYLASMAATDEGVVMAIEDRHDLSFDLVWLPETGERIDRREGSRDGIFTRLAWADGAGRALAYLSPSFDRLTVETADVTEVTPEGVSIHELAGPTRAGDDWVVAFRTDDSVTARTVTDDGWSIELSDGSDLALAADRAGNTYLALRENEGVRVLRIDRGGTLLEPDLPVDLETLFDAPRPLDRVQAMAPASTDGRLFLRGLTAGEGGDRDSCFFAAPETSFASCIAGTVEDAPVALASAALDDRIRDVAVSAMASSTAGDAVIDLDWEVEWREGSGLLSGSQMDVGDESPDSWPDGSDQIVTPPYGGLALAPIRCGFLLAWGDLAETGRVGTVVVRVRP